MVLLVFSQGATYNFIEHCSFNSSILWLMQSNLYIVSRLHSAGGILGLYNTASHSVKVAVIVCGRLREVAVLHHQAKSPLGKSTYVFCCHAYRVFIIILHEAPLQAVVQVSGWSTERRAE